MSAFVPASVERWRAAALAASKAHPALQANEILAIVWSESWGNPAAYNKHDPSWGLMGVSWLIAHAYGGFPAADDTWHEDGAKNLRCGTAYLADLKGKYEAAHPNGAWVAAYNAGETKFRAGFADQAYVDAFNAHLAALNASAATATT